MQFAVDNPITIRSSFIEERPRHFLRLQVLTYLVIILSLFLFPLFFGGVHPRLFYPYAACLLAAAAIIALSNKASLAACLFSSSTSPVSLRVAYAYMALAIYILIQYLVLTVRTIPHPVLGTTGLLYSTDNFIDAVIRFCFFTGLFIITRLWLASSSHARQQLNFSIVLAGAMLAALGVAHWFYDNGLFLWSFAPDYVHASDRARWPFVNPNHLGDILLLSIFPALTLLLTEAERIEHTLKQELSRKGARLAELLSRTRMQKMLFRASFLALLLVLIAICLAATLSRGAWTGALLGLLLLYALNYAKTSAAASSRNPALETSSITHHARHLHARRHRGNIYQALLRKSALLRRFAIPIIALGVFLILLQGKGVELVEGRIEYGLLYSKSDLRWQLYADTLNMIRTHIFWGVGLGNWESNYFAYMSPLLAGVNPVYLHSDPLQMLAELGLIGSLPIIFVGIYLCIRTIKAIRSIRDREKQLRILGLFSGLLAFVIASAVEFPFRIPAIAGYVAISLALLCAELDTVETDDE